MTKEEARATIEAELFALKLRKRMALPKRSHFARALIVVGFSNPRRIASEISSSGRRLGNHCGCQTN